MSFDRFFRCHEARVAVTLLAISIAFSSRLNAQGATTGSILGTVVDSAGAVVPNASIEVKNIGTGQVRQAPTDAQGRYTMRIFRLVIMKRRLRRKASRPRCAAASR
jgi:hypothetical protein